ncbi:MAG TPA: hypothetical protein VM943_13555, partial [Pyrinomonadaceae bacterium]|nr:hypothetical protein [Pyrinomonadaceae bacterium]
MKKAFVIMLLLSLLIASAAPLSAQLRSRRVGNPPPSTTPTPTPTPLPRNAPANQKTGTSPSTSSEPIAEEVGEDDVVRVNTALVTIPVSIMDRD